MGKKTQSPVPATGFVQAAGEALYDGAGDLLLLRGVNLGNWFVQEYWMNVSSVGKFETGIYTQKRGIAAMEQNPNLTKAQIQALYDLYMQTYITERDFDEIAALNMNAVRVPFTYLNLTEDGTVWREDAFRYLDWTIEQAKKRGLYVILDLHGGVGSQNQDHHSGDDGGFALYPNKENREATVAIWKAIAARYRGEKTVAGYDFLNEPRRKKGRYAGKAQFDFYNELYRAVRAIDPDHMIFMECFTFPTHGVSPEKYGWKNVCYEYHIYNLTPFSQKTALRFYRFWHRFKRYRVPVFIGEWNAWGRDRDWRTTAEYFEKLGWSYCSWTYKTNAYNYTHGKVNNRNSWGLYELQVEPVDVSAATFEEIERAYRAMETTESARTHVYGFYEDFLKNRTAR